MNKRCLPGMWCSLFALIFFQPVMASSFTAFESGQVRPLAMSPDGSRLFAVNTPDNRLEVFDITPEGLDHSASVPVGMEPVAVAAVDNSTVWVVNHLSDSVSIVHTGTNPRVMHSLLVGDEPRDIIIAGSGNNRAFITTAHRGQNSPLDPQLTTPGVGRADVWVFDTSVSPSTFGGSPLTIISLFTDTPRALAASPDGGTVYAAGFHTGNRTTTVHEGTVCDDSNKLDNIVAAPCSNLPGGPSPGGLPLPTMDKDNIPQPEVGLIVKHDGTHWRDELNRNWDSMVKFNLPDKDVFVIDANAEPPVGTGFYAGVGTVLFNMAVNPVSGKIYVSNTDANNHIRFEGTRPGGDETSTVIGQLHKTRISVIDGIGVNSRHLNKHIDYNQVPSPVGVKEKSLAIPTDMAISGDGKTLYLAAFGSGKIGIFETEELENDTFTPDAVNQITLGGGGPAGLVLDELRGRLYVLTRFDNAVTMIEIESRTEVANYPMHNPEPASIINGRPFLYDANLTSSNGEASCASCHVFGDLDSLAWDLGDPQGSVISNPGPFALGPGPGADFHPMKGPMATQTLRGMAGHGAMHWRGDRTGGNDEASMQPDQGTFNEDAAFKKFNVAFEGLLGRSGQLAPAEMQAFTDFALQITLPPNPVRALDNSLTSSQQNGRNFYFNTVVDTLTCNGCHVLDPSQGFFGSDGRSSFEAEPQHFKVAHLRNMYQKVGMFGMPDVQFFLSGDNAHKGDQIRGFGFLHDGSVDTLFRFLNATLFSFNNDTQRRDMEDFLLAFDTNLAPVVGQQITLTPFNRSVVDPRIDLLIARAVAGDSDLIVKYTLAGEARGAHLSNGTFETDKAADAALTDEQIRNLAQTAGQEVTYTAVPVGAGARMAIDRDEDLVLDGDDNCPGAANPGQENNEGDTPGDVCDPDDDNDGLDDEQEQVIGTDPFDADSDDDGLGDAVDPIPLTFNFNDGNVAPLGSLDSQVNMGDYLVLLRAVLGLIPVTNELLAHGDLYPAAVPDGKLDISDLILLQKLMAM